ncbi:MAG: LLM class flavin-dependent oxidoreductase [Acidimicrobiales bacterium]
MELGLALPQFDYSKPGGMPPWETTVRATEAAYRTGFDAVFLADHLFMSVEKYGAPAGRHRGVDPIIGLAALATIDPNVRLGILVSCAPLRPIGWLAKNLAGLDVIAGGRLIAGLGAGWHRDEFVEAGVPFVPFDLRMQALESAVAEIKAIWAGDGPPLGSPPLRGAATPIWVGGKSPAAVSVAARVADGWNVAWQSTPDDYRAQLGVFEQACEAADRDPGAIFRSVGLFTLIGDNEKDLRSRFEAMAGSAPPGAVTDGLDQWREGRLVGTVAQVSEQLAVWADLGVSMFIASPGALPFEAGEPDVLSLLAAAQD